MFMGGDGFKGVSNTQCQLNTTVELVGAILCNTILKVLDETLLGCVYIFTWDDFLIPKAMDDLRIVKSARTGKAFIRGIKMDIFLRWGRWERNSGRVKFSRGGCH
jgi:hypothetical protein